MKRFRRVGVCALVLVIGVTGAHADTGDRPYWKTNLFKRVLHDQKFLVTRWFPHEMKDPWFVSTLAVGVAIVAQSSLDEAGGEDAEWSQSLSVSDRSTAHGVSNAFTQLGNGISVAAILGITYLSSRRAHDERLSESTSLAAESLLNAGIWVEVLKLATARARPYAASPGSFFQYGSSGSDSFPSGHAMGAFSVAAVYAETYRDKRWVPWLSYGLASFVGASRVTLGRHFPGDVVVGAVLGTSIGRGVVARSGQAARRKQGVLGPVLGPHHRGVGIGWSYSWK